MDDDLRGIKRSRSAEQSRHEADVPGEDRLMRDLDKMLKQGADASSFSSQQSERVTEAQPKRKRIKVKEGPSASQTSDEEPMQEKHETECCQGAMREGKASEDRMGPASEQGSPPQEEEET